MIDSLIQENFDVPNNSIGDLKVKFISMKCNEIRGFSGINDVFINKDHFIKKYGTNEADLKAVGKMDIITISVHEFAHVRLRQVCAELKLTDILTVN